MPVAADLLVRLREATAQLRWLEVEFEVARRRRAELARRAVAAGVSRVAVADVAGVASSSIGLLVDGAADGPVEFAERTGRPAVGALDGFAVGLRTIVAGADGVLRESLRLEGLAASLRLADASDPGWSWAVRLQEEDAPAVERAVRRAAAGAAVTVVYRVVGDDGVARRVRERLRRRELDGVAPFVIDGLIELEPEAEDDALRAGGVVMRIAQLVAEGASRADVAVQATELIAEGYDLARVVVVLDDDADARRRFGGRERAASAEPVVEVAIEAGAERGVLVVQPRAGRVAPDVAAAAEMVGLALRCIETRDRHARGATIDDLTGLPNRRSFDAGLAAACARARVSGEWVALALLDIDHFKRVNDLNGHPAGDEVLRRVADALADGVTGEQVAARAGGEEFAILMPATDEARAVAAADELRAAIAAIEFPGIGRVTASAGVATARGEVVAAEFYANADAALYAAKRSGRDRTRAFHRLGKTDLVLLEPEPVRTAQVLVLAACASANEGLLPLHNERVGELAAETAAAIGLDPAVVLRCRLAGLLHDVGKIAVPLELLARRGPLSEAERDVVRRHVEIGADLVSRVNDTADCAPIIRHHLEHFDGSGHPDGLRGSQIPIESRIVAAASLFATLVEDRAYAPGLSWQEAIDELRAAAGSRLDPAIVTATIDVLHQRHAAIGHALDLDDET